MVGAMGIESNVQLLRLTMTLFAKATLDTSRWEELSHGRRSPRDTFERRAIPRMGPPTLTFSWKRIIFT
jgi:hypothetical protein